MGNASTKDIKADQIDGGGLVPNGIYTAAQDYDFRIVQRLILQRKLAPFYKGLEDCDDSEDAHEEKLKLVTLSPPGHSTGGGSGSSGTGTNTSTTPSPSPTSSGKRTSRHGLNQGHGNTPQDLQSRLYQGAVECPICFLTHGTSMAVSSSNNSLDRQSQTDTQASPSSNRRRSTSHKNPEVVAADDLRPDWNRRILAARQPGSRRASTSSSVSGATFAFGRRLAGRQGSGSRRSNSAAAAEYGYLSAMRHMGTDLEELMIIEAMRQSIQDENERQAREAASGGPSATSGSWPVARAAACNSKSWLTVGTQWEPGFDGFIHLKVT
ncbi:SNF1-interacting protein [Podila minutissima]|uniref:SNF1-interacting protein n=1 Tax=Podila minutissima TaxID=64525 RepID=A0A9P5SSD8_9FUNG|nr:SNF1-interacting protein [Podila minutissima]